MSLKAVSKYCTFPYSMQLITPSSENISNNFVETANVVLFQREYSCSLLTARYQDMIIMFFVPLLITKHQDP